MGRVREERREGNISQDVTYERRTDEEDEAAEEEVVTVPLRGIKAFLVKLDCFFFLKKHQTLCLLALHVLLLVPLLSNPGPQHKLNVCQDLALGTISARTMVQGKQSLLYKLPNLKYSALTIRNRLAQGCR